MKPDFAPLRVTLVDALGALLPGLVWIVLLASIIRMLGNATTLVTPIGTTLALLDAVASKGLPLAVFLLLCALAIGYGMKPVVNRLAEWIVRWPRSPGLRFPYPQIHEGQPYFDKLRQLALETTGATELSQVERFHAQPFLTCKRFLRLRSPALWEEAEHAEAETRMMGSLFLASVAGALLTAVSAGLAAVWSAEATQATTTSLLLTVLFGQAYRRCRGREVSVVYLNTLVVLHEGTSRAGEGEA